MSENFYSDLKITNFPDKLASFREGRITAPIYVRIKPLNRCNHDCFMCCYASSNRKAGEAAVEHVKSGMHEDIDLSDEIPTERMLDILKDLRNIGVKALTFSGGGEPTMHKGFGQFGQQTLALGMDLSVITNGAFLNTPNTDCLKHAKWVRVSLDYTDQEEMTKFRRCGPGAFKKLMHGLGKFADEKMPSCSLGINFIVNKFNYGHLHEFTWKLKEVGVNNVRFSPVWTSEFEAYHAEISKGVLAAIESTMSLAGDGFTVNSSYDLTASCHKRTRQYTRCLFMQVVPVIGADLNVYACHNKAYDKTGLIGSIKDRRFSDLWFSPEAREVFTTLNPCVDCKHQCANDSKNRLIHGLLNTPPDSFV